MHPEFGLLCPRPRFRREVRIAAISLLLGGLAGAVCVSAVMTEGKKIVRSKAEMLGGYPARRILIEDGDKDKIEARIVFADNRLIQALFVGPAGNQLGRRFLDSFAIVDPN